MYEDGVCGGMRGESGVLRGRGCGGLVRGEGAVEMFMLGAGAVVVDKGRGGC